MNILRNALLRSAKKHPDETVRGCVNIICGNLKILKQRSDDEDLKRVILSQIDELNALLRRE